MTEKIIVTNSGDTAVVKQLLNDADLDVVVVTEPRFAATYPDGTTVAFVDSLNDPYRTAEQAQRQVDLSDRQLVISLSERASLAAACLRSYLSLHGPGFDTVLGYTNKYVMKSRFAAAGLPVAAHRIASTAEQARRAVHDLDVPVVIKPVMGAGADAMLAIHDATSLHDGTLDAYLHRLEQPTTTSEKTYPILIESLLPLTGELHCDGYIEGGDILYARASRYLRPVLEYSRTVFGSYTLSNADPVAREVLRMHATAVRALDMQSGPTHFEGEAASAECCSYATDMTPGRR